MAEERVSVEPLFICRTPWSYGACAGCIHKDKEDTEKPCISCRLTIPKPSNYMEETDE